MRRTVHPQAAPADGKDAPERALPAFTAPALLLETPADIALSSPQSATLFAGQQLSATAHDDAQLSAQHTLSAVAGEAASLYTHAGGIKAVAAAASLSIEAHDGPLEILADQDMGITSSHDEVHVLADRKIVLQAGQSSITLEGMNITFACPGKFAAKGGAIALMGGGRAAAELEILPTGTTDPAAKKFDQFFCLRWANSGRPMQNQRFKIRRKNGSVQTATTDAHGRSPLLDTASVEERLSVELLRDELH